MGGSVVMAERSVFRDRPCLVCHTPCHTEGQLCADCVADGASSNDTSVTISLNIRIPESLQ